MNREQPEPRLVSFLNHHGADELGHSNQHLLDHLVGTWRLLKAWDAPEAVCRAGLFHSVYGTESYTQQMIPSELRPDVQALIGAEAEALAYLFGVMEKSTFYPNLDVGDAERRSIRHRQEGFTLPLLGQTFEALCEITVANWLEQRPRVAEKHRMIRATEFRKMLPFLSADARAALSEAYGFE